MKVDIIMPKMGESITEGTILEWRKAVGDEVARDEILLEIGTDKVDSEIPSSYSGTLVEILAQVNEVVEVGLPIARIETDSISDSAASSGPQPDSVSAPAPEKPKPVAPSVKPPKVKPGTKRFYTPVVMKMAQEAGISMSELERLPGTGRNDRITKKDIQAYLRGDSTTAPVTEKPLYPSAPGSEPVSGTRVEMDHVRKLIAGHMRHSLDTSAHVYVVTEVDMTPIVNYVKEYEAMFKAREGFSLTYTPFIIDAVVQALKEYPEMNASLDGTDIVYHKHINMGMAVAIEKGLMVPAIFNCEELNFLGICRKVYDVASRTRKKQISPDELQGSTFTITNFGVFNVTMGMPIINQPNVGILGVGTVKKRPVVIESEQGDTIGIRPIMAISLGMDHRLIDGAGGSRFIDAVRKNLETMKLEGLV